MQSKALMTGRVGRSLRRFEGAIHILVAHTVFLC
jgi:hypothetical protein